MHSPLFVAPECQSKVNRSGSRFVLVDNNIYPTNDPVRYIATVKRNGKGRVFSNLGECNANGTLLQYKIKL